MIDENYNLETLTTLEYLDYIRIKLIQLDQHILALYKNPMIKDGLSGKTKIKFNEFFIEVNFIIDETLILEYNNYSLVDEEALKNLVIEFLSLMDKARSIVNDVKFILN